MFRLLLFPLAALLAAPTCHKSRADYRDDITNAVCAEMARCSKVGPEGRFASLDDCRTEIGARYNKQWSAKKCEQRIDPQRFEACKTRAVTNACEGNVLDAVSFRLECGADDVCIAEPPAAATP